MAARRRAAWTKPAPRYTRGVLAKFAAADYVLSPDTLLQLIETAGAFSEAGVTAGLSVATASLDFHMSSKLVAGIADELIMQASRPDQLAAQGLTGPAIAALVRNAMTEMRVG